MITRGNSSKSKSNQTSQRSGDRPKGRRPSSRTVGETPSGEPIHLQIIPPPTQVAEPVHVAKGEILCFPWVDTVVLEEETPALRHEDPILPQQSSTDSVKKVGSVVGGLPGNLGGDDIVDDANHPVGEVGVDQTDVPSVTDTLNKVDVPLIGEKICVEGMNDLLEKSMQ
ncbi:hypothetical protein LIER_38133 [Lithospermum erythrorhizon]|uniref:Uncharacterized protein n=1 Tax=Lithospermum erythrorhizon TaxID=34254 RepID=A0AAV3PVA2_LITER